MNRKIIHFRQDEEGDWIAELACGHSQHVRHRPPFVEREWVMTEAGRKARLGDAMACRSCDRLELPQGFEPYRSTPVFDSLSVPKGLLRDHQTGPGTWGRIDVLAGALTYTLSAPIDRVLHLASGDSAFIPPEALHCVALSGDARFQVTFLKRPVEAAV
ncbi:DUF3565 domain-containing protein [Minwuia sp.]|uniref:DUF3565 domain-containing protein n=1 Tax=Minwuia sp. TaxID=2493630 RepID=UPI003A8F8D12